MAMNLVWCGFVLLGLAVTAWRVVVGGEWQLPGQVLAGLFDAAKSGFEISLGLVGVMALWLGLLRIGERAGAVAWFGRLVAPLFVRLFPGVPPGHPAGGSIVMNASANLLGLDNAATPLGLKAMRELQELNPRKDTASDAMIMFLVINTAGLTLIPTSVIAIRQTIGIQQGLVGFNAADIFLPTLIGTFVSLLAGLVAVAAFQRINLLNRPMAVLVGGFALLVAGLHALLAGRPADEVARIVGLIGAGSLLALVGAFVVGGLLRKVDVYGAFIDGAKEGFGVALTIIPYLVAMLVAISVFRTSGCLDALVQAIAAGVRGLGLDDRFVPALPVGLMKTLSGSGARGLMVDVMTTHGVESFAGRLAAIIQGSTETTLYVLAVYFGSVDIRRTRHALACGLFADAAGLVGAIAVAYAFYG